MNKDWPANPQIHPTTSTLGAPVGGDLGHVGESSRR